MGKWFPRLYDPLMKLFEKHKLGKIRKQLLQKAEGKVIEIGSGTGFNFPYYQQAEKVVAIEPEPLMSKQSLPRAQDANVPIEVVSAEGEQLPFADNAFDTVVCTLVLCTIPEPEQALHEIRRVCKQDGKVLLLEHVRVDHSLLGRMQDWLTPIWKRLCDGCHLNRNTLQMLREAGFHVTHLEKHYKEIFVVIEAVHH